MMDFNVNKVIKGITPPKPLIEKTSSPVQEGVVTFAKALTEALYKANQVVMKSGEVGRKVATGQVKSVQEVTLTWLECGLVLKMARNITSKVIEGAKTLFQTQV